MPEQNPEIAGWTIWLFTRPANEVGGDLVDYLRLNESKTVLTIADVAGKGLQAALMTSKLQATIRALATEINSLSDFGKRLIKFFIVIVYLIYLPQCCSFKLIPIQAK